jgi:hypothetical protein
MSSRTDVLRFRERPFTSLFTLLARVRGPLLGLALALGCGQGASAGGGTTIPGYPFSGLVDGQPWGVGTAQTNSSLSAGSALMFAELYWATFTPCEPTGSLIIVGDEVILNVPRARGDYPLGPELTAGFFVRSKNVNLAARQGRIVVDTVTNTLITGAADIELDTNNHVSGQFQISVCP